MVPDKGPWPFYELIEPPEFLGQIMDIVGDIREWDDAKWGGNLALEKDPTAGQYIPDDDSWALMFLTDPPVVVFYKVNEALRQVTLLRAFRFDI